MKYIGIFIVRLYQIIISPIFALLGVKCRFYPTCSEYSRQAFQKHGFFRGFTLSIRRISRCHPWGGSGVDEVPNP